jgi:hypothetical protein
MKVINPFVSFIYVVTLEVMVTYKKDFMAIWKQFHWTIWYGFVSATLLFIEMSSILECCKTNNVKSLFSSLVLLNNQHWYVYIGLE